MRIRKRPISRMFTSVFTLKVRPNRKDGWHVEDRVVSISAYEALKQFRARRVNGLAPLEKAFYRWKVVAGK